jgi:hypothetical protein
VVTAGAWLVEGDSGPSGGRKPAGSAAFLTPAGTMGQPYPLGSRAAARHARALRARERRVRAAAPHAALRQVLDGVRQVPRRSQLRYLHNIP